MDYRQFMKLMEPGEESVKDSISTLQEFVNEFPYFQSAHALLAKSMHEQQHVRYEKQLNIAAAYAGNRKSLYELIHNKKSIFLNEIIAPVDSPVVSPSISDVEESENIFIESMNEFVISPIEEEISIDFPFARTDEVKPQANFYKEESEIDETETNYYDELPVADPHDIIRKRLIEILGLKEEKKEEVNPESSHVET